MSFCVSNVLTGIKNRANLLADDFNMYVISKNNDLLSVPLVNEIMSELAALGAGLGDAVISIGFNQLAGGFLGKVISKVTARVVNLITAQDEAKLFMAGILVGNLERELRLRRCFYYELLHYLGALENTIAAYNENASGNRLLRQRIASSKSELDIALKLFLRVEVRLRSPYEIFDNPTYLKAMSHLQQAKDILENGALVDPKNISPTAVATTLKNAVNARVNAFITKQKQLMETLVQSTVALVRRVPVPLPPLALFKDTLVLRDQLADDFTQITSADMDPIKDIRELFDDLDRIKGLAITNDMVKDYITKLQSFEADFAGLKFLAKQLSDLLHPNVVRLNNISDDMKAVLGDKEYSAYKLYAKQIGWTTEMSLVQNILATPLIADAGAAQYKLKDEANQLVNIIAYLQKIDPESMWANRLPDAILSLVSKLPFVVVSQTGRKAALAQLKTVKIIINKAIQEDSNILARLAGFVDRVNQNDLVKGVSSLIKSATDQLKAAGPPLSALGEALGKGDLSAMSNIVGALTGAINTGVSLVASLGEAFTCPESSAATEVSSMMASNTNENTAQQLKIMQAAEEARQRGSSIDKEFDDSHASAKDIPNDSNLLDLPATGVLVKRVSGNKIES